MDDSDLDFVDLCSKLLKRVRKKPDEAKQPRKGEQQSSSQANEGEKRRARNQRKDEVKSAATQPVSAGRERLEVAAGTDWDSGDAGSSGVPSACGAGQRTGEGQRAKEKVLLRMQQFKRDSPPKMMHRHPIQPTIPDEDCYPSTQQQRDAQNLSSGVQPDCTEDSDEALALKLQQELDREAAEAHIVDLEDGGLFFCQICHKDLSRMTPEGRSQHLNRCLDESEDSAPPPPPAAHVPDCPICGKKFKSQKSRSAHLKRCSSDMGVSPAVLLQVLQRQTEERQIITTSDTNTHTVGTKRKGSSKSGPAARKKARKKTEALDEETMVALALSSSLLEQPRETEAERLLQTEPAASHSSMTPVLKWRPGKGPARRKKGAIPRPPPLLLIQDAETALARLQERVSSLLLRSRSPSPPTPTRCPSTLRGWTGAAPLWQRSMLLDGGSASLSEFYTPKLREFFPTSAAVTTDATSSSSINKPEASVQPASEGTAVIGTQASIVPSSSDTVSSSPAPSNPGTGQLLVGSQALRDLMELAEDGMTLTQFGYKAKDQQIDADPSTNPRLSGFIQESEEPGDLRVSGFLPEALHTHSEEPDSRARRATAPQRANRDGGRQKSVALSRLASDLSSMVNNPQLSDVQLQVDSGELFYAHSFMVYARCPLLAELVHESGIGVQEEDMAAAQRVLMSDVPGQAVLALLQFLYTAHCSVPASLQPHVLELASRFDLQELQQVCQLSGGEESDEVDSASQEGNQTDQAFLELLRSMWNEGDEDEDGGLDSDSGKVEGRRLEEDRHADEVSSGDPEICEERVNEDELEEIYEFAATQRQREEKDSEEEEMEEKVDEDDKEEEDGDPVFTKLQRGSRSQSEPDQSLDRSFDRLFSQSWGVYEEGDSGPFKANTSQSKRQQSAELSCRTLLHSSDNLSLTPPVSASTLPVPGLSPAHHEVQARDEGHNTNELNVSTEDKPGKRESQGPRSIRGPQSAGSSQKEDEPELIVLSDSSEEMEVAVLTSRSPSPPPPHATQRTTRPKNHTQIISKQDSTLNQPTVEMNVFSCMNSSPNDPLDCSPEVSWLVPSTPQQPRRSSTSSSTQTKSSVCRTKLFPTVKTTPPSSSALSSPARVPVQVVRREGNMPKFRSSSSELNFSPQRRSSDEASKDKNLLSVSMSEPKGSKFSSLPQDTPLHPQQQPHSSTPLYTEIHKPPQLHAASPLHSDPTTSQRSETSDSENLEKTELGSFHLSPLSEPSEPRSLHQNCENNEVELLNRERKKTGEADGKDRGDGREEEAKGETAEADVPDSSFQFNFMDEPPIAFNDSWGLDVCAEANPGCFSLRLEDSGPPEHSAAQPQPAASSSSSSFTIKPPPSVHNVPGNTSKSSSPQGPRRRSSSSVQSHPALSSPQTDSYLLDPKLWDSWGEDEEEEEEEVPPLSQRVNPSTQLQTPKQSHSKRRRTLVPITPLPHYSDMDTPELKNKLNRFGVRPLPKRQMVLKLKEIHQYTHQLSSSDSEDEAPPAGRLAQVTAHPSSSGSSAQFKEPRAPPASSPGKQNREEEEEVEREEEGEALSASQGSNTSSTAASEESERSNPELCVSSGGDSDSDGGVSLSQAASRLQDRLLAVRSYILSHAELYGRILRYQPLVLSQLQEQLKAAGIRIGAAKLVDFLDSQCITFTTAKPGRAAAGRRKGSRTGRGGKTGGRGGVCRKKTVAGNI